ncbi:hypothetical protein BJ878DRAFT_500926 [Calycina marina]|uniref:Uncharacterized protein n=1 Tax=Calycina marina TaxID=1763456 RepID=A0A9P7Z559_9HELO|nr:hypothetical protein BJ878DRAFT_500926 [Calycina marina]
MVMALPAYTDLARDILSHRLVVEGYPAKAITDGDIKGYLSRLSEVTQMIGLLEPVAPRSDQHGRAGWIHWETSGAHFYTWEQPLLLFSVDVYTCKQFDPKTVVDFTKTSLQTTKMTAKDFSSFSPTLKVVNQPVFKYTLSDAEQAAPIARLLAGQPPRTILALVLYQFSGPDELSNLGRHTEREACEEMFGNDDTWMTKLYGAYDSFCTFFIVIGQTLKRPVDLLRATRNSPTGLMTLNNAKARLGISDDGFKKYYGVGDLSRVWDINTLAIPRKYRSLAHLIDILLYRGTHQPAHLVAATHYVAIDHAAPGGMFKTLRFPFAPLLGDTRTLSREGSKESREMCGLAVDFFSAVIRHEREADEMARPI